MSDQIEIVEVLHSFVEYRAEFQEPKLEVAGLGDLYGAFFRALRPWGISLADVTWNPNPTNAGEFQSKFALFKNRYTMFVEFGGIGLSVINPSQDEAERIGQIIRAGNMVVSSVWKAEIARQTLTMALHVKPRKKTLAEVTSPFFNPLLTSAIGEPIQARGFSLYTNNRGWIVDSSVLHDGALFLRLIGAFQPSVQIEQIAEIMGEDRDKFLSLLRLQIG